MTSIMDGLPAKISADSLHMQKGEEVPLGQEASPLRKVRVALGWSAPEQKDGYPVDIDASAFLITREGRVKRDIDFIFYNNLELDSGAVKHLGDNTTGGGEGDDEIIEVDLERVPFETERIVFSVTIHNGDERQQTFGLIKGAFIRVVNDQNNQEVAHFDLSEDASSDNAMIFGEIAREGMGWKFKAIGQGSSGGLYKIARDFGVNVAPS